MKNKKLMTLTVLGAASVLTLAACSDEKEENQKGETRALEDYPVEILDAVITDLDKLTSLSSSDKLTENDVFYLSFYDEEYDNFDSGIADLQVQLKTLEALNDNDLTKEEKAIKKLLIENNKTTIELTNLINSIQEEKVDKDGYEETIYNIEKEGFKEKYEELRTKLFKSYEDNYDLLVNYLIEYEKSSGFTIDNAKDHVEANFLLYNLLEDYDDDVRFDSEVLKSEDIDNLLYFAQSAGYGKFEDDAEKADTLKQLKEEVDIINKEFKETKETSYYKNNKKYKEYVDFTEKELATIDFVKLFEEGKYEELYIEAGVLYQEMNKELYTRMFSSIFIQDVYSNLYLIKNKPELLDKYITGELYEVGMKKMEEELNAELEDDSDFEDEEELNVSVDENGNVKIEEAEEE